MNAEAPTPKNEPTNPEQSPSDTKAPEPTAKKPPKAINPATVKKAVALGKEMRKNPETTKADVAAKMYELISGEPRDIIVQAFMDGAGLTEKGAPTYYYNCKRKVAKKVD